MNSLRRNAFGVCGSCETLQPRACIESLEDFARLLEKGRRFCPPALRRHGLAALQQRDSQVERCRNPAEAVDGIVRGSFVSLG